MERELLRYLVLEVMRAKKPPTQYLDLVATIDGKLNQLSSAPLAEGAQALYHQAQTQRSLTQPDKEVVREIVWDLIIQRVLNIGLDELNSGWPFFRLTEYGRLSLQEKEYLPYDPEGYLRTLSERIPSLDPLIRLYAGEALQCFIVGCYLATSVMVGAASERVFDILMEGVAASFPTPQKRQEFERKTIGKWVSVRKREFDAQIERIRGHLPRDVQQSLDTTIDGVFALLKNYRDDSGHPTGKRVTRDEAFANLRIFPIYCIDSYKLLASITALSEATEVPA